jgi:hypothetical protein
LVAAVVLPGTLTVPVRAAAVAARGDIDDTVIADTDDEDADPTDEELYDIDDDDEIEVDDDDDRDIFDELGNIPN